MYFCWEQKYNIMARMKKYGGRLISKDTRGLAKKLMRGKSGEVKLTGSRRERKREAVREVYAMKKNEKYGNNHSKAQGASELSMLRDYKKGGVIQHD